MRTGELLVRAARALRAISMTALPVSLARIEHGQTNQKLTIRVRGYNKKKNALAFFACRILPLPAFKLAGLFKVPVRSILKK